MFHIRFMTLSGPFKTEREAAFANGEDALAAVKMYATAGGYTHVKEIEDVDGIRYTARTPGGRSGRNIAFCTYGDDYTEIQS